MRVILCLAALALIVVAVAVEASHSHSSTDPDQAAFSAFMKKHGKTYAHDEFFSRFQIFKSNSAIIKEHNKLNHTWTMGINEFADLTFSEFHARYTGYKHRDNSYLRSKNAPHNLHINAPAPTSVGWRTKGIVTDVKNQGQCGSCWSFSTTGSLEGAFAQKNGNLVSFSEQQLVDCSAAQGDQGCNGGLMDDAFQYIIQNKGLCTEASYPYTAATGTCQTTCTTVPGSNIAGFTDIPSGNEAALLQAIAITPVSVAIEADQQSFQFYSGGVMNAACGKNLDHGVLAVGFGTDPASKLDYYIVKNSWGATWGEAGYIRLVRGIDQCGISDAASYPHY